MIRHSRILAVLRGLAALVVLAAIIAGLPVLLAAVAGNPLPDELPTLAAIGDALTRPADDTVLLGVLRAAAWLVWAAFTVSTVLDAVGYVRGRRAPRLPGFGGVQQLTGKLVTTIMLMGSPSGAVVAATPAPIAATSLAASPAADPIAELTAPDKVAPTPPPAVAAPSGSAEATARTAFTTPTAPAEPAQPARTHMVQRGDTLWDIAQQRLGDPERWPEIYRLNRPPIQDPDLIQPGWQLKLPPATRAAPATPDRPPSPDQDQDKDRQARPSAPPPPPPAAAPTSPAPAATPSQPAPATPPPSARPDAALPGTPTASSAPTTPPASQSAPTPDITFTTPATHADEDHRLPFEAYVTVFATGMLAGGVLHKLAQMRQRQRQARRRGRRIALPAQARPHRTERRLARQADPRAGQLVRAVLRQFGGALRRDHLPVPSVVGVHLTANQVEIMLAAPAPDAPAPFTVLPGSNDMCWQLPTTPADLTGPAGLADDVNAAVDEAVDDGSDPLPGLLTVGRTGSGGYLLIDVEALRVVGCTGPADDVDRLLCTLAAEAATNPWQGWFDAILVGWPELDVAEGRVHVCEDLDEALDLLAWRADVLHTRLNPDVSATGPDIRERRLATGGADDDLTLTLLISRLPPSASQLDRLLESVDDSGGLAAVFPAAPDTAVPARFTLHNGATGPGRHGPTLRIDPLQLTVQPQPLSHTDYDDIVALLTAAADHHDVAPHDPPYQAHQTGPAGHASATTEPAPQPDPGSESVRLLTAQAARPPWLPATNGHQADPGDVRVAGPEPDKPAGRPAGSANGGHTATPPADPPADDPPASADTGPQPAAVPFDDAGLSVRVLGPVQVDGAAQELQPKQAELVLLLALHGTAGLRNEQLRTLLGANPDQPRGADSFRQAVTRTRRRLGKAPDGRERIEHAGDGIYRLHDTSLDWAQFQTLVDAAVQAGTHGAPYLRQALQLVRGQPLEGCYHWWIDTPLLETIRATIVDAAELLAELELAAGAAAGAGRAARVGLSADPAAEQLWRMLMRAENAAGNIAGVHEAWAGCLRQLAAVDADLEPHADTVALYRRLTGRTTAPSTRT